MLLVALLAATIGLCVLLDPLRALFFLAPIWGATIMSACSCTYPACRPSPRLIILSLSLFFLVIMGFTQGYLVTCRNMWKMQVLAALEQRGNTTSTKASLPVAGQPAVPPVLELPTLEPAATTMPTNEEVSTFCSESNPDFGKKLPHFFPLSLVFGDAESWPLTLGRVTCHPMTCMFTEQHVHYSWRFSCWAFGVGVVTLFFLVNPRCGPGGGQGGAGAGLWCKWFWVFFPPFWVIAYVTWVKNFDFPQLWAAMADVFSAAIKDAYQISMIAGVVLMFLVLYTQRSQIYRMLGIEDSSLVYFSLQDMYNPSWRQTASHFQVCVWRVVSEGDFVESHGSCGCLGSLQPMDSHRDARKLLPHQGQMCNMYVRLAYGDNEVQHSRVHIFTIAERMAVNFNQAFQHNFADEMVDDLLFIKILDQKMVSSRELGKVTFDRGQIETKCERVKCALQEIRNFLKFDTKPDPAKLRGLVDSPAELDALLKDEQLKQALGSEHPVSALQLREMVAPSSPNKQLREAVMRILGFEKVALSEGGFIWLAFAFLTEEEASA